MTKPGFIKKRLIALFASDDVVEQQRVVDNYNRIRNKQCYCGHTDKCDCSNPGIYEFKNSLMSNSISEEVLNKVVENKARIHRSPTVQRLLDKMENDPWYVKLKRWWRLKVWVYTCLTRKYWDKSFEGYIFKKVKVCEYCGKSDKIEVGYCDWCARCKKLIVGKFKYKIKI